MAKRFKQISFLWLAGLCMSFSLAWADSTDDAGALKSEIEALKKGQETIQKDISELKVLLKALLMGKNPRNAPRPPFQPKDVGLNGASVLGKADAPVTIIEFTDYQCPYCRRHVLGVFAQIKKDYVDSGKVRYVVRQYPLKSIHPYAAKASEASLCAGDQGQYWDMHHRIFSQAKTFKSDEWVGFAESMGLDVKGFKDCLQSGKNASKVDQDVKDGTALGMRGTPGFFIGRTDPENPDKIKATQYLRGAYPYPKFQKAIDKLL